MITIQQRPDGNLNLVSHYAYHRRLHAIPGAVFDYSLKCWVAPLSSLPVIERNFNGEIYYKTPKWALHGEKKPDIQETYYFDKKEPPKLKFEPYNYQKTGISFMIDRILRFGFTMNSDSMGLGKTIQSIGALKWFIENTDTKKVLIVCKKSIKTQWASEIQKFTDWDMPVFITKDNVRDRNKAYEGMMNTDTGILITNYHNFLNDTDKIKAIDVDFCIVDEAHSIKSHAGKMNNNISKVTSGKRTILLTGTPIMASPEDIYGIVHLATNGVFGTFSDYEKKYLVIEFGAFGRQVIGAKNLDDLRNIISSFMIRRTTDDVSLELPERTVEKITVPMDKVQEAMNNEVQERKSRIDQKKEELLSRFKKSERIPEDVRAFIEKVNEQEKMYIATQQFIADDPLCFSMLDPDRGINKTMASMLPKAYPGSSKTEAALDLIEDIVLSDEKVIVFTHFSSAARLLQRKLKEKHKGIKAYNAMLYTGAEQDDVRERNINAFKYNNDCHILIGTDAMSEGLNLQVAKYLINYEQADTYAQREQRIGRIERIGSSHNNVVIYDLVTENSFDEIKLDKLGKDKIISDALID